jgi:hypothetical protein
MGRPRERLPNGTFAHLLNPERAQRLIEGCKSGLFDAQNAHREGIDVTTLKSWVERGLDEDAEEPFLSFAEGYVKASIELEERILNLVLKAAEDFDTQESSTEVTERLSDRDPEDYDDDDAYRLPAGCAQFKKSKLTKGRERGDWRAAAWFAERRWPLRWGITRQPDGGPKEALKLPEASLNRSRMLRERLIPPPPELVKLYREAGYQLVPLAPEDNKAPS